MNSLGRLSVIVMRPSPTFLLPAQAKAAPVPARGPSNVCFAAGSSFAHGDHASQLWRSFTWAKTTGAGAATTAERSTRKSEGRVATITQKTPVTTTKPMRIFLTTRGANAVSVAPAISRSFGEDSSVLVFIYRVRQGSLDSRTGKRAIDREEKMFGRFRCAGSARFDVRLAGGEVARVNGADLERGAVGDGEHAKGLGCDLRAMAVARHDARHPGAQRRPARIHQLDHRAFRDSEPPRSLRVDTEGTARSRGDIRCADADTRPRCHHTRPSPHGFPGIHAVAVPDHAVGGLRGTTGHVAFRHVGDDLSRVALQRIAEAASA